MTEHDDDLARTRPLSVKQTAQGPRDDQSTYSEQSLPEKTIRVLKLTMNGGGNTSIMQVPAADKLRQHGLIEEIEMFLAEGTRRESLEIELDEMTQAAYDALPDFGGW